VQEERKEPEQAVSELINGWYFLRSVVGVALVVGFLIVVLVIEILKKGGC
jgi:hypothetical protein